MPPPDRSALLSEIVLLISVSVPPSLEMPPPVSARFPETVLLMRVSVPLGEIVDAATTPISPISRDRAVDEGQLPSLIVEDAATIRVLVLDG